MIGKKINQLATELAPESTDLTIIGDPISGVSKKITLAQLGAIFSGAVSFYNDLASFPVSGDINVIYCAKDTQKLYLWSGSAYTEVFPSQALLDTYQLRSEKGNANGYASLDSGGKVPISQLPSSIMEYKGTWNAATNTPTLTNGTGDTGDVYICNVAGTVNFGAGPITFAVGDYVIYSGTIWQRSSGAVGTVTSVAASITGDSVTISGSPVTTSGTLAFAFNGTTAQYIRGNGTLATFPSLTGFVPYTGATANVDLGTHTLIAAKGTFSSSGSGDTVGITHSSGSGIALNITKGGNGEGLYINKTSGSGNAATIIGTLNATTLVKSGGTSSQFLKADGSVDSTAYGTGSVTSVAALTIGTTGTDLSSTVANSTTTPVITLNVPTASATNRGALSSTDWTTFNNKQNALTNPVTGTGTTNYIPKFTGTSAIGNSIVSESGSTISVAGGITASGIIATSGTGLNSSVRISNTTSSTGRDWHLYSLNNGNFGLYNNTDGAYAYQITPSGNLGLGVTPSAWTSIDKAIEIGKIGNSIFGGGINDTTLTANAYFSGGWKYGGNGAANLFSVGYSNNTFVWLTAPSGTAGNTISFTQAMTLNASGNLSIGNTNDTYKLDVSGTGRFNTNDTSAAIVVENAGIYGSWIELKATSTGGKRWIMQSTGVSAGEGTGKFVITNSTDGVVALQIASTGAATFSSSIQTGAPTNGTAQPWRLGNAVSGSISTNSYIIVSVNGTTYSIPALNGLP
jgi:hypothetical protein